jgi:hypothetical protein
MRHQAGLLRALLREKTGVEIVFQTLHPPKKKGW